MKKPGKDIPDAEGKKHKYACFLFLLLYALLLMCLASCEKAGEVSTNGEDPAGESSAFAPTSGDSQRGNSQEVNTQISRQSQIATGEMLLIRGNYWLSGVPGFGANGFSAIAGEYRIQGKGDFSVYLTMEALYFSGEWLSRPGAGVPVLQRSGEEGFMAAIMLDDDRENSWTAVFLFPQGLEGAGINEDDFNRMLRAWVSRVSYFLFLSRSPGDISLPAALEF